MPDKTEQILIHLEYIRDKQDQTSATLSGISTRLGKVENRVTALETRVAIWGTMLGSAIAALGTVVWQFLQRAWK